MEKQKPSAGFLFGFIVFMMVMCTFIYLLINPISSSTIESPDFYNFKDINLIDRHNIEEFESPTPSMYPTIRNGNKLIVKDNFEEKELQVGSVILFYSDMTGDNNDRVMHRIIGIEKDESNKTYYITKGDNNRQKDHEKVYIDNIKQIVIGVLYQ